MTIAEKLMGEVQRLGETDILKVLEFIEALKSSRDSQVGPGTRHALLKYFAVLKDAPMVEGDLVEWQREMRDERP